MNFVALLLVSTLFGGMLLYSFGFAPMVLRALPVEHAGRFLRAAFPQYYLFVIVSSALSGGILLLLNVLSAALALVIAAVAIYARQVLMPQINSARDMPLQANAAEKLRFRRLQNASLE